EERPQDLARKLYVEPLPIQAASDVRHSEPQRKREHLAHGGGSACSRGGNEKPVVLPVEPDDVVAELEQLSHAAGAGGEALRDRPYRGRAVANDERVCEPHRSLRERRLVPLKKEPALLEQVHRDSGQFSCSYDTERIERLRRDLRATEHARELAAPGRS